VERKVKGSYLWPSFDLREIDALSVVNSPVYRVGKVTLQGHSGRHACVGLQGRA